MFKRLYDSFKFFATIMLKKFSDVIGTAKFGSYARKYMKLSMVGNSQAYPWTTNPEKPLNSLFIWYEKLYLLRDAIKHLFLISFYNFKGLKNSSGFEVATWFKNGACLEQKLIFPENARIFRSAIPEKKC